MKANRLHPVFSAVALYLAAWMIFAPILPQLHQAIATHRHVWCYEHHRIEDDASKQNNSNFSRKIYFSEAANKSTRMLPRPVDKKPACYFSNLVVQVLTIPYESSINSSPITNQEIKATPFVEIQSTDILLFAPKHSPPQHHA